MIRDLKKDALTASGLTIDHRFKSWVRVISDVKADAKDFYGYTGDFVKDGTIEVKFDTPQVLLCAAGSGSTKYNNIHYRVVILWPSGQLEPTDIRADSSKNGYALRMREPVRKLLADLAEKPAEVLAAELTLRVGDYFTARHTTPDGRPTPLATLKVVELTDHVIRFECMASNGGSSFDVGDHLALVGGE